MCGSNVKLLKKYNKATQDTKGQMFLLSNWINDALKLNEQICQSHACRKNNQICESM